MNINSIVEYTKSIVEYIKTFMTYPRRFALLEFIIFTSLIFIFAHWNPFGIIYNINFILVVLFLMIISFLFVKNSEGSEPISFPSFIQSLSSFAGFGGIFVMSIIFIVWAFRSSSMFQTILSWSSNILIAVGAIALVLVMLNNSDNKFSNLNTTFNILPSKFIQLAEFIKNEFRITSKIVWIILAMEIILIALHFILPYMVRFITNHDGVELLKEPIYLENETKVSTFEQLFGDISNNPKFNYRYALSTWFTINPQPPNTRLAYGKYTNILNYGNKPRVQFNSAKNTLRVQAETGDGDIVDVITLTDAIPLQKWNHIVINYDGGFIDVFLNGILVASKPNIAPYMQYDDVVVGEKNGIEGGVRNVVYYDRILRRGEISLEYNLLRQ